MKSMVEGIIADFTVVARLAGVELPDDAIALEVLPAPHSSPKSLPSGKMAVYLFSKDGEALKVGKVGARSCARYTSQHYNPGSATSTLAASILSDAVAHGLQDADIAFVGRWIRQNVDRANFLVDARYGKHLLALLEAFIQCKLTPRYEGFSSQAL
ncbi:MAG: hypothetical protein EON58_00580 [Alphaproteobacteria bacterium]|nr:MAG: hypothetical protein EON58_00580 [Alphaproteobacteria bacterium]